MSAVKLVWKRVGKKSGPGNVLNGTWEVRQSANGRWFVVDYRTNCVVNGTRYRTMKEGRLCAEGRAVAEAADKFIDDHIKIISVP